MLSFNDKEAIFGTTKVGERGQLVICKEAREKVFGYDNHEIRITFSCGIADNKDFPDIGIDKLIDIADRREYKAKDMGRNRIVIENNY